MLFELGDSLGQPLDELLDCEGRGRSHAVADVDDLDLVMTAV